MKKVCRSILAVFSISLILIATLAAFYISRPSLILVQDNSFDYFLPKTELWSFRFSLLKDGIRLTVDTLQPSDFTQNAVEKYQGKDFVLFSPVVSALIDSEGINASELIGGLTIALGNRNEENFDVVLRDEKESLTSIVGEAKAKVLENSEISKFSDFNFETSDGYIVDYRYSLAIPEKLLKGVVCPDLYRSVKPFLNDESENKGVLYYVFREI